MRVVKRILLGFTIPILVSLLFGIAFSAGIIHTFTNPTQVKHIISNSGVYSSVLSNSLDQASPITGGGTQIPLSDTVLRNAAASTFTPQFIQKNTETVIDSVYRWLDGKTPLPDFYIDLSSQRTAFATSVAQSVQQQLASLPVCASGSVPQNFDALNATCLPYGVTPSAAAASLRSDILSGQGFLDNPVITADSIKASGDTRSIFADQLKDAPQAYRRINAVPSVLAALSILVAIAIFFLSLTRRSGVKKIGFILLASGVSLLLLAWLSSHITADNIAPKISLDTNVLQTSMRYIVVDLVKSISRSWWYFGAAYCVLGIALIAISIFWHKQPASDVPPTNSLEGEKGSDETPGKEALKTEPAPKKSQKIIIQ